MAAPGLGLAGGLALALGLRIRSEEGERRNLRAALTRYLPPAVCDRLLRDPEFLRLGGRRKELTLVVLELHDFAEASERMEPEELEQLLGGLTGRMTEIVFEHQGTLDRFTGRRLQVFFGDPQPQPDHPLRGVRCALAMRAAAAEQLRAWASRGHPGLLFGIGVHTGYVTVGNIGSALRMEYTILGRNVEVAERLARAAAGKVTVSARTMALTRDRVIYEAIGNSGGASGEFEAVAVR